MIKTVTPLLLLLISFNLLAEDVIITGDVQEQDVFSNNGPVVNLGSPPKDTFFSFGNNNSSSPAPNSFNSPSLLDGGISSNLFSYEGVISQPDNTSDSDSTNLIISAGIETVLPTGFSYFGGFSFIVQDSFETAFNVGGRFYSGAPIFNTSSPAYSYIGVGMLLVNGSTFYPEVGIRMSPSENIRMDFFFKAYTSSSDEYDQRATLGLGLSF